MALQRVGGIEAVINAMRSHPRDEGNGHSALAPAYSTVLESTADPTQQ